MKFVTSLILSSLFVSGLAFGEGPHDAANRSALQAERPLAEPTLSAQATQIEAAIADLHKQVTAFGAASESKASLAKKKTALLTNIMRLRNQIKAKLDCGKPLAAADKVLVDKFNRLLMSALPKKANVNRKYWWDSKMPLIAQDDLYEGLIFYADMPVDALTLPSRNGALFFERFAYPITAVFNPADCDIARKTHMFGEGGVALAYNPRTRQVEEKQYYWGGVAGVYNPLIGQVEWKQNYSGGVSGAFNPKRGIVEWNTAYESGTSSVYNPMQKIVEHEKNFSGGINGVYDPKTWGIHYEKKYESGVALVSLRAGALTTHNAGYAANEDDDD